MSPVAHRAGRTARGAAALVLVVAVAVGLPTAGVAADLIPSGGGPVADGWPVAGAPGPDPRIGWPIGPPWGGPTPAELLARAPGAVAEVSFRGELEVSWTDGRSRRSLTVPVVDESGVLWMGERRAVGSGPVRLLRASHGDWETLWSEAVPAGSEPDAGAKYRLVAAGPTVVAGRAATVVDVVLLSDSTVRERVSIDDGTGLVLRRDELDAGGRVTRSVAFRSISDLVAGEGAPPPSLPRSGRAGPARRPVAEVPRPYHAPAEVGHGFVLVDRLLRSDGTVQLFYSDGVFGVSVFQERGRLDWSALPPGGGRIGAVGRPVRAYHTSGGTTVVWEAGGVVYSSVTDAPVSEIAPILASFPRSTGRRSVWGRVADLVLRPFRWS